MLTEHNLIVECDEVGHQNFDPDNERTREQFIKAQGYRIIRFNPNQKNFLLATVIADINNIVLTGHPLPPKPKPANDVIDSLACNCSKGKCTTCTMLKQLMQELVIPNLSNEGHTLLSKIMFEKAFPNLL